MEAGGRKSVKAVSWHLPPTFFIGDRLFGITLITEKNRAKKGKKIPQLGTRN